MLGSTAALRLIPGSKPQPLHRDQIAYQTRPDLNNPFFTPMVGCLIAGSRCTQKNGATAVIPGSHLWPPTRAPKIEECTYSVMEPGSALFTLGCESAVSMTCLISMVVRLTSLSGLQRLTMVLERTSAISRTLTLSEHSLRSLGALSHSLHFQGCSCADICLCVAVNETTSVRTRRRSFRRPSKLLDNCPTTSSDSPDTVSQPF